MRARSTDEHDGQRWHRRDVILCAALVGGVLAAYRDSFAVYFLNEDFSWLWHCRIGPEAGFWRLVTQDVMGGIYSWRPLMQLSFGIDYRLSGVNPFGYRVDNLLWHALAACALYGVVTALADRNRATLAVILFALHPAHVESVSWTCARGGPMMTALLLLTVLAYLHARRGSRAATLLMLLCFGLALGAQESAVIFPALVLITDILRPEPRATLRRSLTVYAGMFAMIAGFFLLRRAVTHGSLDFSVLGAPLTAAGALHSMVTKLSSTAALLLMIGPEHRLLTTLATVGAAGAAMVLWYGNRPLALWAVLWVIIASAPFGVLFFGPFPRYLHLPLVGFAVLFAELVATAWESARNRHMLRLAIGLMLALWVGWVLRGVEGAQADFVARGDLTRRLLLDLQKALPAPATGSTLVFHGMGELRVHRGVFIFGLEDAVRLFYNDASLHAEFRALGMTRDDAYHLWYHDGRLDLLDQERK